jgi:tetratricopeptide (TPR) repeat protein
MKLGLTSDKRWLVCSVVLAIALALAGAPITKAQGGGGISGTVLDFDGKPWADFAVTATGDQGAKADTKTDSAGKYTFTGLRPGVYKLSVMLPLQKEPFTAAQVKVGGSETATADLNLQELVGKKNPEYVAALKKQSEEGKKFQGMKQHFDAGIGLLAQAGQAKAELAKAAADQRDTLKTQVKDLSDKAVTELEAAKAAAPEKDTNLHLIWARLGDAYDSAGRADDAANAYKQAIELKPTAAYYNNLGGILGRAGKIDDAMAAYQKSAELDPANAAQAYRNGGITLYNAGKLKEAVEPLKKATELDPKSAQAWYLLGAALVYNMTTKRVGDKEEVVFAPGTIEAYQKAIELDPNGTYGQQAKLGLEQLQQMAPGIDIKTTAKKKKG